MITTIITTYKRPQLLKKAVASVLEQTYPHFQVCVYDNASGDETSQIMQEFVKQDSRVKYHCHEKNIGMMANYEYGFSRIGTPFYSFLSDDDYLLPCFYEKALEGFQKYPDAAFSACGVKAIDETNRIVADPISLWKREGYFDVPEGILEMLRCKWNLLIPTGILFQKAKTNSISPDWSNEIQLMWDPDYLLQIVSQQPIVINKHHCAVYLAHASAYSTSFYTDIFSESRGLKNYIEATVKILKKLQNDNNQITKAFVRMISAEVAVYMRKYIQSQKYVESYYSAEVFEKFYGKDFRIRFWKFVTFLFEKCPFLFYSLKKIKKLKNEFF